MSRRIPVRMDDAFYAALLAFAVDQDRSMANVMLHATRAYLSQHKAWSNREAKTQPRALRTRANGPGESVGEPR